MSHVIKSDQGVPVGAFVPLERPPSAFSLTVRKLIGRVRDGEIRVPQFQRPLRWQPNDVTKLLDSILKGYPIGSLLFWKQPAPADPNLRIGSAFISVEEVAEAWFIVDGQQRITALAATLLDLDQQDDPRWVVYFDPETNRFLSGSPQTKGRQVPLKALGDIRRLGKWLRDCELTDEEQSRVEDVQQRLLDYEIPAYLMETEDQDALRGVFARLNSSGVRMRADEVFQALFGGESESARDRSRLDLLALQEACDIDGFGQPPRPEVLKALLAMSGLDPSKRLENLGEEAISKLVGKEDAIEALRRTVAFLQAPADLGATEPGAGIPAYAFIPYPVAFVILARWFHLYPDPDRATRRELSRWLWRGVATGVHQRAAVSAMRHQVREIRPDAMESSLRGLLEKVGEPIIAQWSLDTFHARQAKSRVELLMLLSKEPRDREGLVSWRALLGSGERVAREIVRSVYWRKFDAESQKLARTAANRILLDARQTGLRGELCKWDWESDREALESHLIDKASLEALNSDQPAFLRYRAARIRHEVTAFLSHRAGIGEPILLPVESYYEDEAEPLP